MPLVTGIAEQHKQKHQSAYGTTELPTHCYFVREFMLLVASRKVLALHSQTHYTSSFEIVLTRKTNLHLMPLVVCLLIVVVLVNCIKVFENYVIRLRDSKSSVHVYQLQLVCMP